MMIVLRFSMQGEDIFERPYGKCHVFTHRYARGNILAHIDGKCQFCTLLVNL